MTPQSPRRWDAIGQFCQREDAANFVVLGLLGLFLAICLNFARQIPIWGDEAFSLNLAETSWLTIFTTVDTHPPTYTWLLKGLINLTGTTVDREWLMRFWHSIPMALGLLAGYKTIARITSQAQAIAVLLASLLLPNIVFYATNIRMYSLLFLTSMVFIHSVAIVLASDRLPTRPQWLYCLVSGTALVLTDYPGLIFYLIGAGFWLHHLIRHQRGQWGGWLLLPWLILGSLYSHQIAPALEQILRWRTPRALMSQQPELGLKWVAKWLYQSLRPAIDLVNPAAMPIWVSVALPGVLILGLLLGTIAFLWRRADRQNPLNWLMVACALPWVLTIPVGYSLTRSFLPSQFFMVAILIIGFAHCKPPIKHLGWALFAFLVVVNLQQVITPTLRCYSLIPYRQVGLDALQFSQQHQNARIVLSDNSLNSLAIERYINQARPDNGAIVRRLPPNFTPEQVPAEPFVFVSHMHEQGQFVDVTRLVTEFKRPAQPLQHYLPLDQLPFNSLWRHELVGRTSQKYAISTYWVP